MSNKLILLLLTFVVSFSLACREKPESHVSAIFDSNQETTRLDPNDPRCRGTARVVSQHGIATATAISRSTWLTNSHVLGTCETGQCRVPLILDGKALTLIKRRDSYDYALLAADNEREAHWNPVDNLDSFRGYLVFKDENGSDCHRSEVKDIFTGEEAGTSFFGYHINTSPGNSGAPLFHENGDLIGLHAGVLDDRSANFAVPLHLILKNFNLNPADEFKGLLFSYENHGRRQTKKDLLRILEESRQDCITLQQLKQHLDASKSRLELVRYFHISKNLSLDHWIQAICHT